MFEEEFRRTDRTPPPAPGSPMTRRLGTLLVEAGVISQADLETALYEQSHHPGVRLGQLLLRMELLDLGTLIRALDELAQAREAAWCEE